MPADMVALIGDYEAGLKGRIYAIVNELVPATGWTGARPPYVRELTPRSRTMAPIPRPRMIMNAAVNFYSHIAENGTPEQRAQAVAARKANRGVPYLFLKAPSSVVGTGDTILIPYGRTELDWEIEVATVVGRTARFVSATRAQDHVFGYTVMLDISDRGGRPPGGGIGGTDWFVMKGQDTFGPMGPFIACERVLWGSDGEVEADACMSAMTSVNRATASDMIHSVWEVIEDRLVARDVAAGGHHRSGNVGRGRHGHLGPRGAGVARGGRRNHGDDRWHRHLAAQGGGGTRGTASGNRWFCRRCLATARGAAVAALPSRASGGGPRARPETSLTRGASPLGLPDTLSRAPLRRRAPFARGSLARSLAVA